MATYIKKPMKVEALQYLGEDNINEILNFCGDKAYYSDRNLFIISIKGDIPVFIDEYIVKDKYGDIHKISEDVFENNYIDISSLGWVLESSNLSDI